MVVSEQLHCPAAVTPRQQSKVRRESGWTEGAMCVPIEKTDRNIACYIQWNTAQRDNTSQQDFGTRKVYCVSNVTFHAESKYAIKIFLSPTVFVQWPF